LRSIASLQRTNHVRLRSSIFRAPRLWIFLISLQPDFFNPVRAVPWIAALGGRLCGDELWCQSDGRL